ncbi:M24 family metallopeptidase [Paenisporosarcina cavernae]|uniref:Aminopeptidase P family protein n=1 Tax=Paenisporosarcina cavernae TaxID=2320858 RepID=A0A385YTH7_9BACL|nr:Xaa-Pro peptidase family protein [Paenisporosarcina cavernae]AYC29844.1 aminopeptidase P family protein [Paenisporosarcina cavernae]
MSKLSHISQFLKQSGTDAAFISTPDNVFYISGFRSNPHERLLGVFVFSDETAMMVLPKMEVPDAKAAGWKYDIIGHEDTDNAWNLVQEYIANKQNSLGTLAIEKTHVTVDRYEEIQRILPSATISGIDDTLNSLRLKKDNSELAILRKAAEFADYAIEVGVSEIAEGKTELEILQAVEAALKAKGITHMSFDTMVLSGPKTASPHGKPGSRKIQKGDFILFDLGVVYEGYCSDITRTVAYGEPSDEQRKIYETVLQAEQAAVQLVKPGVTAKNLDLTARDIISKAGYGEFFTHRLGHGLGISVHEFPSITSTNEMELIEGMVFTIEPGIYVPDVAGVRIEDDVVVTKDGVEILTKYPKELVIIPAD